MVIRNRQGTVHNYPIILDMMLVQIRIGWRSHCNNLCDGSPCSKGLLRTLDDLDLEGRKEMIEHVIGGPILHTSMCLNSNC